MLIDVEADNRSLCCRMQEDFLGWGGSHYAKRSNKDYGKDF